MCVIPPTKGRESKIVDLERKGDQTINQDRCRTMDENVCVWKGVPLCMIYVCVKCVCLFSFFDSLLYFLKPPDFERNEAR